jgi:Copper transport outer membrane protein, MctB
MINFRFHLASLVAVFLALAVGVVMGYGILGQPTVSGLQNRIDTVEANAEAKRAENEQLQGDLDRANEAVDASAPFAVTDRLLNVPSVVVAVRDVGDDSVERIVTLARRAGATAPGIVWIEGKLALESKDDAKGLAGALGLPVSTKRTALRAEVWAVLTASLADGATATSRDRLAALIDAGFVSLAGVDGDAPAIAALGGTGTRVVLAVGTSGAVAGRFLVEGFANAAVDARVPLVVGEVFGEGAAARGDALSPILDDEQLAAQVTTVDDLEWTEGSVAAVLGLSDLGREIVGHYGFGNGAERLLPEWSQP